MKKPIPFGKYYLLDRINVGGMAEVFRAKAFGVEGFERVVAVKRILPSIAEDTDFITMFIDEAKIAVQLTHANIAQIFDLGKVGDSYFIALEYVHGKDLRAIYDRLRKRGETVPVPMACYVTMKLCEGLDYAHNKKDAHGRPLDFVHRDVSPQNILVSYDGEVKIIDFGIAKAAGKAGQTQAGILKGKFGYLSPEQVKAESIDRRSDVFGVGICLFELLTAERLFGGESDFSTLEKVRNVHIPNPTSFNKTIPSALEKIVLKALSKDVESRYQTAMDLHDDLQSFLFSSGEPFARNDLSAWMRTHFGEEAESAPAAGPSFDAVDVSPAEDGTDVNPIAELAERNAVENVTTSDREAANLSPDTKGKSNKATILGMPAMNAPGRSVPPPPPRGDSMAPSQPPPGRSVPPPPPRSSSNASVPPPMPSSAGSAPAPTPRRAASAPPPPPSAPSAPPAAPTSASPSAAGRSVPPPPPSGAPPAPDPFDAAASEPAPPSASSPVLDMDWDDDDLSTQIYDRPEGEFEGLESGIEPAAALPPHEQRNIVTYVPPATGDPNALPGVQVAPQIAQPGMSSGAAPAPLPAAATQTDVIREPTGTHPLPASESRSNTPLVVAGAAALALILFGAYTMFSAKEPGVVQLTTNPSDATVLFDGVQVGTASPFVITDVDPSVEHQIEITKEGFNSWSTQVRVPSGKSLQVPPVTLTRVAGAGPSGGFEVDSTPSGARVKLNGEDLGKVTPLRVTDLSPGEYTLEFSLNNFQSTTARVNVPSGEVLSVPRVTLSPTRVRVRIDSEPSGATVTLKRGDERKELGDTPLTVPLDNDGSPWSVELTKRGYEPVTQQIKLAEGSDSSEMSVTLTSTEEPKAKRRARPRRDTDSATRPAPAPRQPVASGGGKGTLRVNTRPWSQVYVDGRLVGNTPQMNIQLKAGKHRLTLVNPDFGLRRNVTVNIKAGATETKILNLN